MAAMSFLRRLLGGGSGADDGAAPMSGEQEGLLVASEATFDAHFERHRVTVWLRLRRADFEDTREQQRVFHLEDSVMRALDASGAGEHDTNSLEKGFFAMRLIGDDADAVVNVILPLLSDTEDGSYLAVRRGPSGSGEDRISLGRVADA
jgi:hypothetical protein